MKAQNYINQAILSMAPTFTPKDIAPSTFEELTSHPSLIIWTGESDNTIFNDPYVNWAFRAIHDALHLETLLSFTPKDEMIIGRIQASKMPSTFLADLVYCETTLQAKYYLDHGIFVPDQKTFTLEFMRKQGHKI